MSFMFMGCSSLVSINFSNLNTKNVKNMREMFYNCFSLYSMDFSNLDLRNVEIMPKFCYMCYSLVSTNFTNTRTLNLTSYPGMFEYCSNLTSIELTNFEARNIGYLFGNCPNLRYIDIPFINCQSEYGDIDYGLPNYGTIRININCSDLIQNTLSNWSIIIS